MVLGVLRNGDPRQVAYPIVRHELPRQREHSLGSVLGDDAIAVSEKIARDVEIAEGRYVEHGLLAPSDCQRS